MKRKRLLSKAKAAALVGENLGLVGAALRTLQKSPFGRVAVEAAGGWDDAFQEGAARLLSLARHYDRRRAKFSTFAVRLLVRHFLERFGRPEARRHAFAQAGHAPPGPRGDVDTAPLPWEAAERADLWEAVRGALQRLRPDDQKLVTEYYLRGRTQKEMAADRGCTRSNVQALLARVLRELRAVLEPQETDP